MRRNAELVDAAIRFAVEAHGGQTRKGKAVAYLWHPLAVGRLLEESGCCAETVAAGLLHDTLEDTPTTAADLRQRFGERVAGWP